MSRPVLLDLFSGAGGAATGYHRAGFDVVGVDLRNQPNYPFEFIQSDALEFLSDWIHDRDTGMNHERRFGAIHASPPCQRYSTMSRRWNGRATTHPDLVDPTRKLLQESGLPYVIENVPGSPLINPVQLCGSSFGLGVRRHRHFEANVALLPPRCDHQSQPRKYRVYDHGKWYLSRTAPVWGHGGGKAKDQWSEAMGIDWMTRDELAQAIPPAYTEYVGALLLTALRMPVA